MHPSKFLGREQQAVTLSDAEKESILESVGQIIAGKRKDAIDARKSSGIEEIWLRCDENYIGIDDANRQEFTGAQWAKPTSMTGGLTSKSVVTDDTRSNAFVRLTARYVDGAASKLSEIILPIDDKAFSIKPTPVADVVMQIGSPGQQPDQEQAKIAAEKAETRIYDWMTDGKFPAEARKVIKDSARLGVGLLKGPIPVAVKEKAVVSKDGIVAMEIVQKTAPTQKWVDPWNFYPADGCGENIHDGEYCFEKDYISERALKALKDQPGYLESQIDKAIELGPSYNNPTANSQLSKKQGKKRFEIWYYYGSLKKKELEVMGPVGLDAMENDSIEVIVTVVNDTPIKAAIDPNQEGSFPYLVFSWTRRPGHWAGIGPGEMMFVPQRMVNASTRALLNNAGISAGPQIIIDQLGVVPADGKWTITPNKIWLKTGESTTSDVRQSFLSVEIQSVQRELQAIIDYAMRLAEECTNIPLLTQQAAATPQTFGQAELQNTNAHTWLRDVGYGFDDQITEPLVNAYYEWLLMDPDIPNEEKGDFKIDAHGSIAMVERSIQEQTMLGLFQLSPNPAFEIDPAKLFSEYLKGKRLDPRKIQLSESDKAKRAQMPQAPIPQVQVEQVKGQNAMALAQFEASAEMQQIQAELGHEQQLLQQGGTTPHMATATARIESARINAASKERQEQIKTERDLAYVERERQIAHDNQVARIQELQLKRELAILDYTTKHNISLAEMKAELAKVSMQEGTKRQLAQAQIELNQSENALDRGHDLKKRETKLIADQKPPEPLEPSGKAQPGHAFEQ